MAAKRVYDETSVQTSTSLEGIKAHPGMYGVIVDTMQGQYQIAKEVFDNCVDEAIDPNKQYVIDITILNKPKSYQFLIEDNCRGIPLGKITDIFTKLHTTAKVKSKNNTYTNTIGTYGVGAKATAALSRRFTAVTNRAEGVGLVSIERAQHLRTDIDNVSIGTDADYGTKVIYDPDKSSFPNVGGFINDTVGKDGFSAILDLCEFVALFKPAVIFKVWFAKQHVTDAILDGTPTQVWKSLESISRRQTHSFDSQMNWIDYVRKAYGINSQTLLESGRISRPVSENSRMSYDLEFFVSKNFASASPKLVSTLNMTRIEKRTSAHNVGVYNTLKAALVTFIDEPEVASYFTMLYQMPINICLMARWNNATFYGQDKNDFTDGAYTAEFTQDFANRLNEKGEEFLEQLYEIIKEDIVTKYHQHHNKGLKTISNNKNVEFLLEDPKCYADCEINDPEICELIITEGHSSGNHVVSFRDPTYQAVFKQRGKGINPIRSSRERRNSDRLYKDFVTVLGIKPGDKDLSNLRFAKLIILTDADPDGHHICSLLIATLHTINPLILSSGRVIIANPPLYLLHAGKDTAYLKDKKALFDSRISMVYRESLKITMESYDGVTTVLSGQAESDIYYLIKHIGNIITHVSNKCNTHPIVIENLAHCIKYLDPSNVNTEGIKNLLGLDKVAHDHETNNLVLTTGGLDTVVPLGNVYSELRAYVLPELEAVRWREYRWIVKITHSAIVKEGPMSLMEIFRVLTELDSMFSINRMKGIGEVPGKHLIKTCLDPMTRSFTVLESVGDVDRIYELLGEDSTERKALLYSEFSNAFG